MTEATPTWVAEADLGDLRAWLAQQSRDGMRWLLAHADDGVIWGEVRNDQLVLAGDFFSQVAVELRAVTLQQARLFGPAGQLHLWRDGAGFRCHLLTDESVPGATILREKWWLWGTHEAEEKGFTLLCEGLQGLRHAPPIKEVPPKTGRVALKVHHYLTHDEQGRAIISLSRLAGLTHMRDTHA